MFQKNQFLHKETHCMKIMYFLGGKRLCKVIIVFVFAIIVYSGERDGAIFAGFSFMVKVVVCLGWSIVVVYCWVTCF